MKWELFQLSDWNNGGAHVVTILKMLCLCFTRKNSYFFLDCTHNDVQHTFGTQLRRCLFSSLALNHLVAFTCSHAQTQAFPIQ